MRFLSSPWVGASRKGRRGSRGAGLLVDDWNKRRSNPTFEDMRRTGREIARAIDGTFRNNPRWYLGRVITVHPLGGGPMSRNEREGAVDPYGRGFNRRRLVIAGESVLMFGLSPSNTIPAPHHFRGA